MNKRSAMLMAAGLVAALAVGAAALSFSVGGSSATAEGRTKVKPIVETIRDTVTIHKKATGSDGAPTVVTLQTSPDDAAEDFGDASEETMEDAAEHESDDEEEFEDHESDDHEDEDDD